MAGYRPFASLPAVLSDGRPPMPVVDIRKVRSFPAAVVDQPVEVRIEQQGIILPRPARPDDFNHTGHFTLKCLLSVASDVSGYSLLHLRSTRRTAPLVKARHIMMWLAKHFTQQSYPQIGARLGGRDHSTIMHGCRRVERIIAFYGVEISDDPWVTADRLWQSDWTKVPHQ